MTRHHYDRFPRTLHEAFGPYAEWETEPKPLFQQFVNFFWSLIL